MLTIPQLLQHCFCITNSNTDIENLKTKVNMWARPPVNHMLPFSEWLFGQVKVVMNIFICTLKCPVKLKCHACFVCMQYEYGQMQIIIIMLLSNELLHLIRWMAIREQKDEAQKPPYYQSAEYVRLSTAIESCHNHYCGNDSGVKASLRIQTLQNVQKGWCEGSEMTGRNMNWCW